jgi:hypothetical protein
MPAKQTKPQRKDHNVKHTGFQINLSSPFHPFFGHFDFTTMA